MTTDARTVQRTYLVLTLLNTLASSFIWGINTLFLLDAGLTNTEAFAANAFFAVGQVISVLRGSIDAGWRNPPVRWLMLATPFTSGVGLFAFYALQPYLLELYGDPSAYGIAGLVAAIFAGAQIVGGLIVPRVRRRFARRTDVLLIGTAVNVVMLVLIGWTGSFFVAVALLAAWAMVFAVEGPIRQAFINGLIPSEQRATVLSFDSLIGSTGGVIAQPALGRVADVYGYGPSYLVSAGVNALALPFMLLARRERASADPIVDEAAAEPGTA